jgi:hypothetical protein
MDTISQYLPFIIPILVIEIILWVVALRDLLPRQNLKYLPKWAWILVVLFVQIIGPIVYFLIARQDE